MKNPITTFKSVQFGELRTLTDANGEPWFCLVDVCKALDLSNLRDTKRILQSRGVCTTDVPTYEQHGVLVMQELNLINEPNLYKCIFQSRKKEAEAFQDWVCSEVLPSIRKNKNCLVAQAMIDRQKAQITQLTADVQNLTKQVKDLEHSNKLLFSDAAFAKAVKASEHSISLSELAYIIKQNGVKIEPNSLYAWLRRNGYLYKKGEMRNQPTKKAFDSGFFEIKETNTTKPNGKTLTLIESRVTGEGQVYFVNKFLYNIIGNDQTNSTVDSAL